MSNRLISGAVQKLLAQARRSSHHGLKTLAGHPVTMGASATTSATQQQPQYYNSWTKDSLIERVRQLEEQLRQQNSSPQTSNAPAPAPASIIAEAAAAQPPPSNGQGQPQTSKPGEGKRAKKKKSGGIDMSKYATRMIALKLAYLGKNYNGFEYQKSPAPLPTIEDKLWKALTKSCLISPENPDEVDFAPFEYSKCGRTDKGVSAFGQVINLRVRSNQRVPVKGTRTEEKGVRQQEDTEMADTTVTAPEPAPRPPPKREFDPIADEIPYCRVLNRLLPPDIRILAWAPHLPENFSSRFSCRERQYRYFFTSPAFTPMPASLAVGGLNNGWLDIDAMRKAAKMFEGVHDFRNFCKVDPGKQLTNFTRRVFESDIVEVTDVGTALPYLNLPQFARRSDQTETDTPKVYYFHVRGSAFLWHQIRHMVAVLFLVGQGLEPASVVSDLLDVNKTPRRPCYLMAEDTPLVLWDCIFPKLNPEDAANYYATSLKEEADSHNPEAVVDTNLKDDGVDWLWLGEDSPTSLHSSTGLVDQMWEYWRERKMDELLASRLLGRVATQADLTKLRVPQQGSLKPNNTTQKIFRGGNVGVSLGQYVPVLKKEMLPTPEEQNDKWAQSKGFAGAEEMVKTHNWRSVMKANRAAAKRKASMSDAGKEETEAAAT
ncbi:pseudouridine synthase [Apodospora peruviana]|uniref:Pseudouridine synthase n=1 Tax=Apodospora peruviana TaxID=516989 RepID=A0AAE0HY53_9PEZI|nr:pseudouridine synthase [Apodospora peruviana]